MSREAHVQFCESLGVRFPGATHLVICCRVGAEQGGLRINILARVRPGVVLRSQTP